MKKAVVGLKKAARQFRQKSGPQNYHWAVYTPNETLMAKITSEGAKGSESDFNEGSIFYGGGRKEIPVFFVPYHVVEYIEKNRHSYPDYICFHSKKLSSSSNTSSRDSKWVASNGGRKSPSEFLKKTFANWGLR